MKVLKNEWDKVGCKSLHLSGEILIDDDLWIMILEGMIEVTWMIKESM